jgi:hypothetical protein
MSEPIVLWTHEDHTGKYRVVRDGRGITLERLNQPDPEPWDRRVPFCDVWEKH